MNHAWKVNQVPSQPVMSKSKAGPKSMPQKIKFKVSPSSWRLKRPPHLSMTIGGTAGLQKLLALGMRHAYISWLRNCEKCIDIEEQHLSPVSLLSNHVILSQSLPEVFQPQSSQFVLSALGTGCGVPSWKAASGTKIALPLLSTKPTGRGHAQYSTLSIPSLGFQTQCLDSTVPGLLGQRR